MMNGKPRPRTSRFGAILVAAAVGGSALAVLGWQILSSRGGGRLDTSGFDIGTAPDHNPRPIASAGPAAAVPSSSLGMVKSESGMRVAGAGGSSAPPSSARSQKEKAALSLKEAALKNEKLVEAFGRRMEARYPSLTQYGKDWVSYPDLRALRDQYWRDHDPLTFAYGMVKSDNFGKLLKKYAADPGTRAFLMEGVKQAPADLLDAAGQIFQNDHVAKDLVNTVIRSMGLPAGLTSALGGDASKPPDQNKVLSDIMQSPDVQKALRDQKR